MDEELRTRIHRTVSDEIVLRVVEMHKDAAVIEEIADGVVEHLGLSKGWDRGSSFAPPGSEEWGPVVRDAVESKLRMLGEGLDVMLTALCGGAKGD